jgi:hypothetical protein
MNLKRIQIITFVFGSRWRLKVCKAEVSDPLLFEMINIFLGLFGKRGAGGVSRNCRRQGNLLREGGPLPFEMITIFF